MARRKVCLLHPGLKRIVWWLDAESARRPAGADFGGVCRRRLIRLPQTPAAKESPPHVVRPGAYGP